MQITNQNIQNNNFYLFLHKISAQIIIGFLIDIIYNNNIMKTNISKLQTILNTYKIKNPTNHQ